MYLIKSGVIYDVSRDNEKEFVSPFAEELYQLDSKSWEADAWKYKEGQDAAQQGMVPRGMLWGGRGKTKQPARVRASYVAAIRDRLYYVLEMTNSCGLFYYDFARDQEIRLFHKAEFQPRGLCVCDDYTILTTAASAEGTVHLAQYDAEGRRERILTSGDCTDENPYRSGALIYYQSCGVARSEEGSVLATGHTVINTLNVETGDVETLLASEKYDYLLPKVDKEGTLYCIQVPHQARAVYSLKQRLLDIALFPWRLCVAIFAFLNVFSMLFAKKPLTMAGGSGAGEMDISRRVLHNRVVNLQETMRQEGKRVAVSKSWKLVRYAKGQVTEIASNVLWFDLNARGEPLYTDGYAVYDAAGAKQFECDALVSGMTLTPPAVSGAAG